MRSVSQYEPLACAPCSDARALGLQRCRSNAPSNFWGYRIKAVGARDAVQASQFNGKQEGESHTDEPNLRCPRNGKQTGGPRHCQGPHFSKFRHWVTPGRRRSANKEAAPQAQPHYPNTVGEGGEGSSPVFSCRPFALLCESVPAHARALAGGCPFADGTCPHLSLGSLPTF